MGVFLQDLDFDVWISVEYGVIKYKFDRQARKEIMRRLSKSNIEKLIYFKTAKEIWDKLQSIYEVDMQVACDVKRLSMEYEVVKYSKSFEDHESVDDSFVSIGQFDDQHPENMKSTSNLFFCCYCRKIDHLSSNCSTTSNGENERCSSSCSKDKATLIAIENWDIGQEDNGFLVKKKRGHLMY